MLGSRLLYVMTCITTVYCHENVIRITWVVKHNTSNDPWKISRWEIF